MSRQNASLGSIDEHLRRASELIESYNPTFFHCMQRQLGKLRGDADGRELMRKADEVLYAEGIRNPERWTDMSVPGI